MGLADLESQIIRTPLSPLVTMLDDPLRALRVIRFATRFGFTIDPELYQSISSAQVQKLLALKVSKERVLTEFSLMMSSYQTANVYFNYLVDTGLIDTVFPTNGLINKQDWILSQKYLAKSELYSQFLKEEDIPNFILASIFQPSKQKYGDQHDLSLLLDSFRSSKKQMKSVVSITSTLNILYPAIDPLMPDGIANGELFDPEHFETSLRPLLTWLRGNDVWDSGLCMTGAHFQVVYHPMLTNINHWAELIRYIEMDLVPMANAKNILDGHEVKEALGLPPNDNSPITEVIQQLVYWQWKNFHFMDKESAREFVKAAALKKKKKNGVNAQDKKLTAQELIAMAEGYIEEFKVDMAIKTFKEALVVEPRNTLVMDTLGELLLEMGELDKAKQYFIRSVQTDPEDSSSKYMNLGQLLGGEDAIRCYNKGIELMERDLKTMVAQQPQVPAHQQASRQANKASNNNTSKKDNSDVRTATKIRDIHNDYDDEEGENFDDEEEEMDPIDVMKDQICSALCSIAELYLTDECAEVECEKHLLRAIEHMPMSPEPYSLLASMKISQVKNEDALQALSHSYSLWSNVDEDKRPSLEYRFGIAQMFIELDQHRTAVDILEVLVYEQDNIAEIWYSLGLVYHNLKDPRSALECLETATKLLAIAHDGVDEDLKRQIDELIGPIQKEVSLLPPEEEEEEDKDEEMQE
eukprot:gene18385-22003_t